jgi:hypothetical protein
MSGENGDFVLEPLGGHVGNSTLNIWMQQLVGGRNGHTRQYLAGV